jgi:hypothetical protein
LLVSDASFRPVFLEQYSFEPSVPVEKLPPECARIMDEKQLLDFGGETVIVLDTGPAIVLPAPYHDESLVPSLLEKSVELSDSDRISSRYFRDRDFHLAFAYPAEIGNLQDRFKNQVKLVHSMECLVSLSDQVQASDHQRGFIMADIQPGTLSLLVIQEDGVELLNRFALKDPSDFIYHTLNTLKQLGKDRESIPLYLSGIIHPEHELFGLLEKYIRNVKTTPYYLEELSKIQMLRFMVLSEGSKCA